MVIHHAWPLVTAQQMRALDRHTIETLQVAGEVLMESAGRAVAERVAAAVNASTTSTDTVTSTPNVKVVCGAGNNGGDGFVIARHLHQIGIHVVAVLVGTSASLPADAEANYRRMLAVGVSVLLAEEAKDEEWGSATIVVDALFGTGLSRVLEGEAQQAVERINRASDAGAKVIAVDVPSGIDTDTGQVLGTAVRASETVTIGLPKVGLALEPGREHAGKVFVARIGIEDHAPGVMSSAEVWTPAVVRKSLPVRPKHGHKGSFGHVLVVAGAPGMTGAAHLASLGAARMGAGLVTVACPAGVSAILEIKTTEAMTVPIPDTEENCLAASSAAMLMGLAHERDVVVMGPGIGQLEETAGLMRELGKLIERPLVLDADGLNAFSTQRGLLKILAAREAPTVLTPHPGEAARLLGVSSSDINRDRIGAARKLCEATGSVVLLKGACSVIAAPDGRIAINPNGGPNLSSGGTGDVLAGMVGALLGQGLDAWNAATLAAWIHGATADSLSQQIGPSGMLASELADALPACCEEIRRGSDPDQPEAPQREREFSFLLPFPGA
jgi:hydroxyethylthiazole kinase-like uncharacterized protein yjeF